MQQDTIEQIHGSLVQHGRHNDRVYVMRLDPDRQQELLSTLDQLARTQGYGKIFAKIPATSWSSFRAAGYHLEALVPEFFGGVTDCCFVALFFAGRERSTDDFQSVWQHLQEDAARPQRQSPVRECPVVRCTPADGNELARLYREVFASYPFPIFNALYLVEAMGGVATYYAIWQQGRIVAAAATETDTTHRYAEVTDFATLPSCRRQGLAAMLLHHMEGELARAGIITAFTICRATSLGMNRVFQKSGYRYCGLLVNNTQIAGRLESMSVWSKRLL